jgi:Swiss Army Knife RNA repair-like protein
MKVIFFDIDGVLNCTDTPNPRKFPYIIDARLLRRFKRLLKQCKAKGVLASSWRVDPIGLLAAKHFNVPFIDVCPDMPSEPRCVEIRAWLLEHSEVARYAVIDDEDDGLDDMPLFQPSRQTGLTPQIAKGVARYLAGQTDEVMRANALVRIGQNIHALFKRDKS